MKAEDPGLDQNNTAAPDTLLSASISTECHVLAEAECACLATDTVDAGPMAFCFSGIE